MYTHAEVFSRQRHLPKEVSGTVWRSGRVEQEEGGGMIPVMHDMKAGFFLMAVLAMLLLIGAIAALRTVLQPIRWSDRKRIASH